MIRNLQALVKTVDASKQIFMKGFALATRKSSWAVARQFSSLVNDLSNNLVVPALEFQAELSFGVLKKELHQVALGSRNCVEYQS